MIAVRREKSVFPAPRMRRRSHTAAVRRRAVVPLEMARRRYPIDSSRSRLPGERAK
jgi:hypothetical protein